MKKYSKISVVLVVMLLVSSIGFSTAFGYGSHRANRNVVTPVITLAPVSSPFVSPVTGRVLGVETMSAPKFISTLASMGIISPDRMSFINLLISLGIIG